MSRSKIVSVLVAATLLLAGCGSGAAAKGPTTPPTPAPVTTPGPDQPAPQPVNTTPAPAPAPSPTPPAPGNGTGGQEPGQGTNVGTTPANASNSDTAQTGPAKSPAQAATWYVPKIGYPMKTDDPAAKDAKVVMLTFDDGPTKEYTPLILDVLKENNVKAMFFVTGYGAKNEDLVKREAAEGHVVGTHTVTHDDLTKMAIDKIRAEINPVNDLVEKLLGQKPKYFRPPFGSYNDNVLKVIQEEDHMQLINWSVGSLDWDHVDSNGWKDPKKIVADTLDQMHSGAVILMHDTHKHTTEALPLLIKALKEKGYEFVVMR